MCCKLKNIFILTKISNTKNVIKTFKTIREEKKIFLCFSYNLYQLL